MIQSKSICVKQVEKKRGHLPLFNLRAHLILRGKTSHPKSQNRKTHKTETLKPTLLSPRTRKMRPDQKGTKILSHRLKSSKIISPQTKNKRGHKKPETKSMAQHNRFKPHSLLRTVVQKFLHIENPVQGSPKP